MLVDSHCHLTDQVFEADREAVLDRAAGAGVAGVVVVGSDVADTRAALDLVSQPEGATEAVPFLWATAGIHPHEAAEIREGQLREVEELARSSDRVVAIGEIGLDFHYDFSPRAAQLTLFLAQLELAERLGKPVVVHSRDADEEMTRILTDFAGRVQGVLHCFTGGDELLEAALESGWLVSFAGMVTFKNFTQVEQLRAIPRECLMVETDAPYLAPAPHRGKRNEPAYVGLVARRIAELRGEAFEEVARYTTDNAARFFHLDL